MSKCDDTGDDDGSIINNLMHVEVTGNDFVKNALDMIASHLD